MMIQARKLAVPVRSSYILRAGPHTFELGTRTLIMGIVNVTPDSFSRDGCLTRSKDYIHLALRKARKHIREGAQIIDIGGESSRPGARHVSVKEELRRVIPVINALRKKSNVAISIDTYKTEVAQKALDAGAVIVNNIQGAKPEKNLLKIVAQYDAAIILMHMRGQPASMQKRIYYRHLIKEIRDSLRKSIEKCLETGIKSDKIIIDPGIGFGKTVQHNLEIINRLKEFEALNKPLLIGTSRKSFIGKVLNNDVSDRLIGTIASICASIMKGAHIVRVHDVKPVKQAVTLTDAILNQGTNIN